MLVIHGIGEQNPYETLDNFARHLAGFLRKRCDSELTISPQKIAHDDWVEVCIRLTTLHGGPERKRGEIDLYEYYWAPCTEDKITYRETLAWLIKTDLSPIQHFGDNVQLEKAAAEAAKTDLRIQLEKASTEAADPRILPQMAKKIFWREIVRIMVLYLPVLVVLIGLAYWLTIDFKWSDFYDKVSGALAGKQGVFWAGVTAFLGMAAVMAWIVASSLWKSHRRKNKSISPRGEQFWIILASASIFQFVGLAWLTADLSKIGWEHYLKSAIVQIATLKLLLAAGVAAVLRYFLTAYVGDVAVYVNADAKSKNYEARCKILSESALALTRILKDKNRKYNQVIVAGHSLGSVIAYDTIDELLNESGTRKDQLAPKDQRLQITQSDLEKLTGLITFGSPLDKVYYFFREHVAPDQAIRAQILSYLHSFRKVDSGRHYDPYKFEQYTAPEPSRLLWLNAWSKMDIISGRLHFYKVDERKQFRYWQPVFAHLSYWRDPEFYEFIATRLLLQ